MAHETNTAQLRDELVDACAWGEVDRARDLVSRFGAEPKARAMLEEMLREDDARARQAAAFGLGELGGATSVRRLEQLPSFISTASALREEAASQKGEAAYYCDRLFALLLRYKERLLPALPEETRAELRTLARDLVPAVSPNCSFGAAVLLESVGRPEDAAVIEANRPEDSVGSEAFDAIARALRNSQGQP
jgi:HEAT repeat protein